MSLNGRRAFLMQAGVGAAAAWSAATAPSSAMGANDRLSVGVIGPGGMGSHHLDELLRRNDVQVAYVCDVDANRWRRPLQKSRISPVGRRRLSRTCASFSTTRRRRRLDRDTGPLACARRHSRLRRGKTCVRGKASAPQPPREAD